MSIPTIKEVFSGTLWTSLRWTRIFEKVYQMPSHAIHSEK